MATLADRVKRERKLLGWAVEELAVAARVGISTVRRIEGGENVRQKKVLAVLGALKANGTTPEEMRRRSTVLAELRSILLRANELVNDLDRPGVSEPIARVVTGKKTPQDELLR